VRSHLSRHKIVGVVGGRDLDSAGSKCHVNEHGIAYDGNASVDEGVNEKLAVQMRVPRVFGVDLTQMLQKITARRGGRTATAVSPSMVSRRVVATTISSSLPSTLYANSMRTPNSYLAQNVTKKVRVKAKVRWCTYVRSPWPGTRLRSGFSS
jgi:hypothetical protein